MKTTLKRGTGRRETNGAPTFPVSPLTSITRYGPPRRSPVRALGRFLLWTFAFLFVVGGGAAGGFFLFSTQSLTGTRAHSAEAKAAERVLDAVPPASQPAVAVVIGYDTRMGPEKGNPPRSDTVMLLRADPKSNTMSMLSFPRDLVVTIPACRNYLERQARINEAFTECGMRGTVQTVQKLTGIPINYMIAVNFRGFIQTVNKLGGVYLDVDRRYFNDNSGLGEGETYATIDLHAGYQRLMGGPALSFVRYRHTDSDLYRNARQQEFVKALKQQVSTFWSVPKLPGVVQAIKDNVEIGVGGGGELDFELIYRYARFLHELPAGNFQQVRIEGLTEANQGGAAVLVTDESEIAAAVERFMNPDAKAAEKAATAATGQKPKAGEQSAPPPSSVTIEVLNGNGVAGAADDAAYLLSQRGYQARNGGNADRLDYFTSTVLYDPTARDGKAAADAVADLFGDAQVQPVRPGVELDSTLRVIVGQTFKGTLAPGPPDDTPKHEPPAVEEENVAAAPGVRAARRSIDFELLLPTVRARGSELSDLEPFRRYKVNGEDAVRFVYNGPMATDYWGIQETSWTDAPMLDGPSVTRTIRGREYRLFFNGPRLHVVAFEQNGAAYWVVNTLLDSLSNETMLAIARGLKPAAR